MKLYIHRHLTIFSPVHGSFFYIPWDFLPLLPTSSRKNCFIQKYDLASCKIKTCSLSGLCRTHLHFRLVTGSTEAKALSDTRRTGSGLEKNLSPLPSNDIRRSLRLLPPSFHMIGAPLLEQEALCLGSKIR